MLKYNRRKIILAGLFSLGFTLMQITGWQISMKYGTSVHQSAFFQKIGVLAMWQCVLLGIVEFFLFGAVIYFGFTWLERRSASGGVVMHKEPQYSWVILCILLFVIYLFFLIGCYPGFYNYDVGNQVPQVLYEEVPYNAHHPLLHTFVEGGIIALGYRIYNVDMTFGVFLYNAFQMAVCAVCFTYALRFIYQRTRNGLLTALAFGFYALCPPIVMFAMSTTKDVLCYAFLLVAVIELYAIYDALGRGAPRRNQWVRAGVLLVLSCLFRKNIVYAVILLAMCALLLIRREQRKQIIFYVSVVGCFFCINKGLIFATNASEGSVTEALSVPFQQLSRLYAEEGEEGFTEEELELLYSCIEPSMLGNYDPFIADEIKFAFWQHLDTIVERKWEFIGLWARKGLQYPKVYLASILDNTYQAWYPGTVLRDTKGYRYFDITLWTKEYGTPKILPLFNYYKSINDELSYQKYPILRLFFSIGAMFWVALLTWGYGLWRRDRGMLLPLGLVLLVCLTSLWGPVSDVRYYLILFYMMPVCIGFLFCKEVRALDSERLHV